MRKAKLAFTVLPAAYVNWVWAPTLTDKVVSYVLPLARHDSFLGHNFADTPHALTYVGMTAATAVLFSYAWDAVAKRVR